MPIPPRNAAFVAVVGAVWLLVLAARGAIHARRTGSMGLNPPAGSFARAGWASSALGFAGTGAYVLAVVLQGSSVPPWFESRAAAAAGVVLVAVGAVVSVTGQAALGASWRSGVDEDERTELVTTGLYALSRNPIYAGLTLSIAGFVVLVPTLLALVALLCSVAGSQVYVRFAEEPYLLRTHGDAYRDYASRVGRFLPGLGRLASH